jgi:hypothetical protein
MHIITNVGHNIKNQFEEDKHNLVRNPDSRGENNFRRYSSNSNDLANKMKIVSEQY